VALRQIVLAEIRRITLEANAHRETFLKRAMEKHSSQLKKDMAAQRRLEELDKLFRKAFEQMALEHLSEQQFHMLTDGYEVEKIALSNRAAELEQVISSTKDKMLNADHFLKIVDKYTDIQELTPELVMEFIEKNVVHDRSEPWKQKNYTQQVDVYFNFVGKV
jgi:site-specific DNA recombinase